jgi:hypothetical protein
MRIVTAGRRRAVLLTPDAARSSVSTGRRELKFVAQHGGFVCDEAA